MKYEYNKIVIYFKDSPEDKVLYDYLVRYKNVSGMCKKLIVTAIRLLQMAEGVNAYGKDQEVQDK